MKKLKQKNHQDLNRREDQELKNKKNRPLKKLDGQVRQENKKNKLLEHKKRRKQTRDQNPKKKQPQIDQISQYNMCRISPKDNINPSIMNLWQLTGGGTIKRSTFSLILLFQKFLKSCRNRMMQLTTEAKLKWMRRSKHFQRKSLI